MMSAALEKSRDVRSALLSRSSRTLFRRLASLTCIAFNFASFFRKRLRAASTYGAQEEAGATSFQAALEMIRRGDIDVGPLLSHVLPVESVGDAFRLAHDPVAASAVKVSVRFD